MGRFDFKTRTGQISGIIQSTDGDAQAFFDRVRVAGGSLTITEQTAIINLVSDMKILGIWNSMKAIYPMVGASAASCAQNLKSSSFTGSFTSGWTFASSGVTPNGTSAYMNTTYNPSVSGLLNSAHLSVYTRTIAAATSQFDLGVGLSGAFNMIAFTFNGSLAYVGLNATDLPITGYSGSRGLLLGSRIVSTTEKYFLNNGTPQTLTKTTSSIPNSTMYLGALQNNSSPAFFSNKQYAFATIGDGLTDTQASDFYTAVQAFQTSLSRNI
jgi:hypothetical protein